MTAERAGTGNLTGGGDEQDLLQGYAAAFRSLLFRLGPRDLHWSVTRLLDTALRFSRRRGGEPRDAFEEVYRRTARRVTRHLRKSHAASRQRARPQAERLPPALDQLAQHLLVKPGPVGAAADFWCDAALGGLARWLRAAGYDARWEEGIDDDQLLQHVAGGWAILLTTDRPLLQRGVIQRGLIPALWVSPALDRYGQLSDCVDRLRLVRRAPRCMSCGGRLAEACKAGVAHAVPARTLQWQQQFYRCRRCRKVLWRGSHWQRIERRLAEAFCQA